MANVAPDNVRFINKNKTNLIIFDYYINFHPTLAFTDNYDLNCGHTLFFKIVNPLGF